VGNNRSEKSPAIKMKGLTKNFGKEQIAVKGLDLSIKTGEIFSLLGPNGAGKTTTIKMLCCLLAPTAGTASIMGRDLNRDREDIKQIINVSPQETAVALNLTALENLVLMGRIYGLESKRARKRAQELIEIVDLGDRKNESVKKFSGGMLRRLSIAMALISDPQVLFLDEPTTGLDARSRRSLWRLIEYYRGKKTIVLTTHYLEEADALSDRIAIINRGELVALGTSEKLKKDLAGMETMHIRAENLDEEVLCGLEKRYSRVQRTESGLIIENESLDFNEIVDYLRTGGVTIRWLSMQDPSLDQVYLKITERGGSQ